MKAIKGYELRDNFKEICDLVNDGETIIVSRPNNKNIVVLSEQEYNLLEKTRKNAEYISKLEQSLKESKEGNLITFSIEELEKMENMSESEAKEYIKIIKSNQGILA